MEVNLHELKVVCFLCVAVLKGQTIQRNAGRGVWRGSKAKPRICLQCPIQAYSTEPVKHQPENADARGRGPDTRSDTRSAGMGGLK